MSKILHESIYNLRNAIESTKRLVFLVGAGISFEPPSYLTTWPQSGCIKAITSIDLDTVKKLREAVRPEVFFQVLYNITGKKALIPLEVLNPVTLNSEEKLAAPNILHFFLAEMIHKGHIVLTTNFDNLIEMAYEKVTNGQKPKIAIFDTDFQNLYEELNSLKSGCLIKIHGSFVTPEGRDCRDSIIAILQQVQREFPESKRKLVKKLIEEHDLVVMGYSGQDDFDIYPFLLEPPTDKRIWWLRHLREEDPKKWDALLKSQLEEENKVEGPKPVPLRNYKVLNPNSIVLAYSHGILIKAHTAEFVKQLLDYHYSPPPNTKHKAKVEQKMQAILKQWVAVINSAEKHYILAGIFETAGRDFLDQAREYHNKACEIKAHLITTRNILKRGIIHYKKDRREEFENAKKELEKALKESESEKLSSMADQAETCLQLLLVHNKLEIIEKGIEYGERAVNLYKQLAELDDSKIFELAQALRGLALISSRAVPDISAITKMEERVHNIKILEESSRLCEMSLRLLQKIGNRSGERGEGQAYNVLGMIKLKLSQNYEDYKEAREYFDKFLDLSGRSRFLRESFQGYRNIALCEYNLALKEPDKKNEWLDKTIQNYDYAIECLGSDPKLLNERPGSNEFNARFNKSRAKIEQGNLSDVESAQKELIAIIKYAVPALKLNWHWKANILSSLSRASLQLDQYEEAYKFIEEMVKQYEEIEDNQKIEKQPFGIQNARQNLQSAIDLLEQMAKVKETKELHQRVLEQLERISNLSQHIPSIPLKEWFTLVSQIEAKFLK
jgi:tetratricopeptide (TPR) repeat protein